MTTTPNGRKQRTIDTHTLHITMIKQTDLTKYDTLLLGDSLFENLGTKCKNTWLNCSVGGDCVEHLLWRMFYATPSLNTILNNFTQFKNIIILIGTNNTGKKNYATNIYHGIINIVSEIKKVNSQVRIIVLAIPPRTKHDSKTALCITSNTVECNALLSQHHSLYEYYDITNAFATITNKCYDLDTKYFCDDVHFSNIGYDHILERLQQLLTQ
jgi:lysophospholipase L1-like esterase